MATILRKWSYQYPWLYNAISRLAALPVGGEMKMRHLALKGLSVGSSTKVLDLCCGGGQTTQFLVQYSKQVTGLDASPTALSRAAQEVPEGHYVEGLAENMPFEPAEFDLVHTSVALHEMEPQQLRQILGEVYRVLKPGGVFTLIDLHKPTNPLFLPPLAVFMWLFETDTAWQLLEMDLMNELKLKGFRDCQQFCYAGGSLQVIQARK